jgi:uncharacterized protein YbjT (DUF2867 family)
MAVPTPHGGPTADKDRDWSWSENEAAETDQLIDDGGWGLMVEAHAWFDGNEGDPPKKKGAYKLPHHQLIDGELRVVWSGVAAAMNVVAGGRGGVNVPDEDIQPIYEHLAKHYRQFDEEPPEL